MDLAVETEIAAAYINEHESMLVRHAVGVLGHRQLLTPKQVENVTAVGFINNTIK